MLSEEWEEYAKEHELDVEDQKLRDMFEWAWHTAVNECCSYLSGVGQFGLANLVQDFMRDKDWDYDEYEEEE
jgi:hypothetical protein